MHLNNRIERKTVTREPQAIIKKENKSMKKSLKRFIKLSWHGIPIGIIATVLIGTAVLAAVLLSVTQHITQTIVPEPVLPDYGSITAPGIALNNVQVNGAVLKEQSGAVVVQLEADGLNKFLHLKLREVTTDLYADYEVKLISSQDDNPMCVPVILTVTKGGTLDVSSQLTHVGTYTFVERITATAGSTTGSADVEVDITLEDS